MKEIHWEPIFHILGILVITVFLDISVRILDFITKKRKSFEKIRSFIEQLKLPILWLIWGVGFFSMLILSAKENITFFPSVFLEKLRTVYIVIIFAWIAMIAKELIAKYLWQQISSDNDHRFDKTLIITFNKILSIVIFVLTLLLVLDAFDVPLTAVLAFGGIGGLALGLAAKDMIANFFGGLMIFVNRPFCEGDWIKSPNKNFEGVVETIGWYMTRIRTFERRPTYIPNALITDAIIENPGRMYNRRIRDVIRLSYSDVEKIEKIADDIGQMLKDHPKIDSNQFLFAELTALAESSVDIDVYCFTKTTRYAEYRKVQQDVFLKIAEIVKKHGASFAYPSRSVYLHENIKNK